MEGFFRLTSPAQCRELLAGFQPLPLETVLLDEALGRVCATPLEAPEPLPPFARSTMDGLAVRGRDLFGCSDSEPALIRILGEISMGGPPPEEPLRPGTAWRIWTGGCLPPGADAVVMKEYVDPLDEGYVEVRRPVAPGENVIARGEDFAAGDLVLPAGHLLRPQDLGVAAGLGVTELEVHARPRVAILSTGDELVPPDQEPGPGRIRDMNTTTLAALCRQAGALPEPLGIVPDQEEAMARAVSRAADQGFDVVLVSGGSSVGRRDYTLAAMEAVPGARILMHGVALRPGKPTILAARGNQALIGLPGHAASAMVVFYLVVRPLLLRMQGMEGADSGLVRVVARLAVRVPSPSGREEYLRVRLEDSPEPGGLPLAWPEHGRSGLLNTLVRGHGLLRIDRDSEGLEAGETAPVFLFPQAFRPISPTDPLGATAQGTGDGPP